jgi:acetoin utilization deacetylase AcuC-like enzyme
LSRTSPRRAGDPIPIVYHEKYEVDIGPHVFPTAKYRLVLERLLEEGTIEAADVLRPEPATDEEIALVHTAEYVEKIRAGRFTLREQFVLEVPFSPEVREASWLCAGGSILAARASLDRGCAVHLGGGFHHAFPDHGEGFCLIHDVAVAIRVLQHDGAIRRAAVIDCDVHHGNGTAATFANDPEVFTFSIHQERNYPASKPPSDLDLGLEDGVGDAVYLAALESHVPRILETHRSQLAFYLAGADPYREDQLGGLALTISGLRRRDAFVLGRLAEAGVPVVVVLAGGYARRLRDTVEIHANTVRVAKEIFARD